MFDSGFDQAWHAARAADLDLIDEGDMFDPDAVLSEADLAWLHEQPAPPSTAEVLHAAQHDPVTPELYARLDAIDPDAVLSEADLAWLHELPVPSSTAEVLRAAQHDPVTPELYGRLDAIDPAGLDEDGRLAWSTGWQRISNASLARRGLGVAALAGGQVGDAWVEPARLAAAEVGAALNLGAGAADLLVDVSVTLPARFGPTLAAALRGDLSWDKAVTLAQLTAPLTDEQAAAVEARVLPFAVGRTPAQHRAAVRRWVDRIDPAGAEDRRRQARADVRLIATHYGNGMGELFARMPSEQLDTVRTAASLHARAAKAAGDPRTLEALRVAALVGWAESYLTHGNPTTCDVAGHHQPPADEDANGDEAAADEAAVAGSNTDDDVTAEAADVPVVDEPNVSAPTRHGRRAVVRVLWDLSSLLGVTGHCGELADSGVTLPPQAMRELLARGARIRRLLIDPDGELADLSPCTWILTPTGTGAAHLPPVQLQLIIDTRLRDALLTGDRTGLDPASRRVAEQLIDLLPAADPTLTDLLAYPVTADDLDNDPDAEHPSPALAEFVAVRDRHPVNPTAGPTPAGAADFDHTLARSAGGQTTRDNIASLTRRWHLLKTHGGWTYQRINRHWEWTSPTGRTYQTRPYDYRLGP